MDKKEPPRFEFVFGGFKQITDESKGNYQIESLKLLSADLGPLQKRYRMKPLSKPGKLCKKVFPEDYEQEENSIEETLDLTQ